MPLFVPILRLLMLFLNVYDSYKTLKQPPPSSRNGGKPSVRALTQRKRDMKGCLAVWIVWMCLTMYERVIESVVSLFIPFYDEFKSLVFVFLILTRARGAEPIYLHVIRPSLKPYTSTLDGALEVMLMFGDFIFALTTYPIRLALDWWNKKFGHTVSLDNEMETQTEVSANDDSPDAQSSEAHVQMQTNGSTNSAPGRRGSSDVVNRSSLNSLSNPTVDLTPSQDETTSDIQQQGEVEEWRKYPAFPSAYPPTPLVTTSRHLPPNRPFPTHLQPQPEQEPQQDFRQSLLPPREPLNPSYAGDTSDRNHTYSFGIHSPSVLSSPSGDRSNFDTEDSLDYIEDEEDDFNITLRTPLRPMGSLRLQLPEERLLSPNSPISGISLPSRSSALTTLDLGSLRTNSESGSSPSSAVPSNGTSSVNGKKRAHAPAHSPAVSPRVRQVRAQESSIPHRRRPRNSLNPPAARRASNPVSATSRRARILPADDDSEFVSTTTTEDEGVSLEKAPHAGSPPEEKRRKVSQPSDKVVGAPTRKSAIVRPLRQRVVRQTSPTQPRRLKSVVLPENKRTVAGTSKGLAPGTSRKFVHKAPNLTTSASTSSNSLPLVPPQDK